MSEEVFGAEVCLADGGGGGGEDAEDEEFLEMDLREIEMVDVGTKDR